MRIALNPVAAQDLRATDAAVPAEARAGAIAAALGFPGAQVTRVRGFGTAGAPAEVELDGAIGGAGGLPLALGRPSFRGGPTVGLSTVATTTDVVELRGRAAAPGR